MKLERFKERDNKRIGIIVFTIVCILLVSGVILYRTFAIFEVKTNQNVIKGTVQDPGNIYFAFYVNDGEEDKIQKEMPTKNYVLDEQKSFCGVNGEKDPNIKVILTNEYGVYVTGMTTSRTKCNLYFVSGSFILGKPIKATTSGDGLYEVTHGDISGTLNDGFKETEFRYAGAHPNNYITFNGEKWRIIGLVNVMTSETEVEQRIKIVKNESIGKVKWEELNTTDWMNSNFQNVLNTNYYNQQGNYSESGLNESSRNMVEMIMWNIGKTHLSSYLASGWYEIERDFNDSEKRNVGLIYPSDYNYAVGGESRALCLSHPMYDWYANKCATCEEKCAPNDWIKHLSQDHFWTLASYQETYGILIKNMGGLEMSLGESTSNNEILPTLYLKSNVKIIDGLGTEENPYKLALVS